MSERDLIVGVMRGWIGKKEADNSHREIIDIYNKGTKGYRVKYTDAWCATTVSAAAIEAGLSALFPLECSCQRMIDKAITMGIWVEDDAYIPNPGDLILYSWKDSGSGDCKLTANHVGMVESVNGTEMTIIEGNMSDAVGRRKKSINSQYIRGYITPRYKGKTALSDTKYYPIYLGNTVSIITALTAIGEKDTSKAHRAKIAEANGIKNYAFTAEQNTKMLNLLKNGKLKKAEV